MDPKEDSEKLVNALLPFAERMLRQYGEFFPFGAYLKSDGTIVEVGAADPDADRPKSKNLIDVLRRSFQEMARANLCKCVAVVFDVTVVLPASDCKSGAIQACVDHAVGYSVEVFFPYQLVGREIVHGETFAQLGKHEIFVPKLA